MKEDETCFGMLFIVGTPIGCLEDITIRALRILENVDIIACEDTRRSSILLNHYKISKKLISYRKGKEREVGEKIIKLIKKGKDVAIITDAGMPSISDPGAIVVKMARDEDLHVTVVPGPSAITAAYALSGINADGFVFLGFLQDNIAKRREQIEVIRNSIYPVGIYVAPHDVKSIVKKLLREIGDREVCLVKEMTKIYEDVKFTNLKYFDEDNIKGEYVMFIMPGEEQQEEEKENVIVDEEAIRAELEDEIEKSGSWKDAIKTVAKNNNTAKDRVYKIYLTEIKNKRI